MTEVTWHKVGEPEAEVEKDGKTCTKYEGVNMPIVTLAGGLLFVSSDNKYHYEPNFIQDSIRTLIDHCHFDPVMRPISEGLINDIRFVVEETMFYATENPKEWSGVAVAEEILEYLETLAKALGTSLKEIQDSDRESDLDGEDYDDPYDSF